ncbi:MAG: OmpH family outer membrane protein [Magnetospiraceae bacterium]
MSFQRSILIAFLVAFVAFSATPVRAQEAKDDPERRMIAALIVVIDVDRVMIESNATKSINEVISKTTKKYEEEATKTRDSLKKEEEELAAKRALLAPDAFNAERRKFLEKVAKSDREVREKLVALEKGRREALVQVEEALTKIIKDIVQENGITLVLRKRMVPYAHPQLEITKVALDRLNEALPKVKVSIGG